MGLMSIIFIAVGFSMDAFAVHTEKAFLMPGLSEKFPLWYNQFNKIYGGEYMIIVITKS